MKVIILGLDGMTNRVVAPYVRAGHMPNLKKIIETGTSGDLKTTIPPVTGPGWTSLATGKNPGKHGVFDFRGRNGYETELVTKNTSFSAEPIWDIISRKNKRVVVADIPFTYPPDPVNGTMISGMMTPDINADFVYPPSFKKKLLSLVPDYKIDVDSSRHILSGNRDALLEEIFTLTKDRRKIINYFLKEKQWDFYFHVLVGTDRLQHVFWDEIMDMTPICVDYYRLVDDILGDVLLNMDEQTVLFLVSDHGFMSSRKSFYINSFLKENGFLSMRGGNEQGKNKILHSLLKSKIVCRAVEQFGVERLKSIIPASLKRSLKKILPGGSLMASEIDWEKTTAFAMFGYGMVFINLKGREPQGVVVEEQYDAFCLELETALMEQRDPETGKRIVSEVHKGREIYKKADHIDVPDLIVILKEGYSIREEVGKEVVQNHKLGNLNISGDHDQNGFWAAFGSIIRATKCDATVYDIMPTVLYIMGLPLLSDIDGKVLQHSLAQTFLRDNTVLFEKVTPALKDGVQLTKEERDKLTNHLKSLGYMK